MISQSAIDQHFLKNKYLKWYLQLMTRPCFEPIVEKHHVHPRSLGGSNEVSNLICLSPRQHFIAHLLLSKCTRGPAKYKMSKVLNWMLGKKTANFELRKITSRSYQTIKEIFRSTPVPEDTRRKLSLAQTGRKYSLESRKRMSENRKGKKLPEERRLRMSQWLTGVKKSDLARKHISEGKKGKTHVGTKHSEETKKKMSLAKKGKKFSDEHRRKLSEAQRNLKIRRDLAKAQLIA